MDLPRQAARHRIESDRRDIGVGYSRRASSSGAGRCRVTYGWPATADETRTLHLRPVSPAHRTPSGTHESGLAPLIRKAADRQTQTLRHHREPEKNFTEPAAQAELLQTQAQQRRTEPDGTLEDSIRNDLAHRRRGVFSHPQPHPRSPELPDHHAVTA
ncbi:hypothetical protein NRF20_06115 [Streptomyces sp. R-74717]|uniref:hypothetical protein n=1 Tax=Streptomyces TaxID=1883 RepID=UPI00378920F1